MTFKGLIHITWHEQPNTDDTLFETARLCKCVTDVISDILNRQIVTVKTKRGHRHNRTVRLHK